MTDSIRELAIKQARAEGITNPREIGRRAGQLAKEECVAQMEHIVKAKIAYMETLQPRYDFDFENIAPRIYVTYSPEELQKLEDFDECITCIQRSALGMNTDPH
jgi:hypothetical protein